MIKRHGFKILLGLYALLLIGTIVGGIQANSRVKKLSNRVTTVARVLSGRLESTDKPGHIDSNPLSGEAFHLIQSQWSELDNVPRDNFPTDVIAPVSGD